MNRSEQSMLGRLSRCGLAAALVASAWLTGVGFDSAEPLHSLPQFSCFDQLSGSKHSPS